MLFESASYFGFGILRIFCRGWFLLQRGVVKQFCRFDTQFLLWVGLLVGGHIFLLVGERIGGGGECILWVLCIG